MEKKTVRPKSAKKMLKLAKVLRNHGSPIKSNDLYILASKSIKFGSQKDAYRFFSLAEKMGILVLSGKKGTINIYEAPSRKQTFERYVAIKREGKAKNRFMGISKRNKTYYLSLVGEALSIIGSFNGANKCQN